MLQTQGRVLIDRGQPAEGLALLDEAMLFETVARHLSNIFTKAGVSTRAAATAFAFGHDMIHGVA